MGADEVVVEPGGVGRVVERREPGRRDLCLDMRNLRTSVVPSIISAALRRKKGHLIERDLE